jgi:hypothetical protein
LKDSINTRVSHIENKIENYDALNFYQFNHDKTQDFSYQIFFKDIIQYRFRLEKNLIKILNIREPFG